VIATSIATLPVPPAYTKPTMTVPTRPITVAAVTVPSPPTVPAAPTISHTDGTAPTTVATTIAALPAAPAYTKPVISAPTAPDPLDITDVSIPTSPTAPTLATITHTDGVAPSVVSTLIGTLPIAPTYTKPTVNIPADPALATLTLPEAPTEGLTPEELAAISITYTDGTPPTLTNSTIGALPAPPTFTKPTVTAPTRPTSIASISIPTAPTPPTAPAFTFTPATAGSVAATTLGTLPAAPSYTGPTNLTDLITMTSGTIGSSGIGGDQTDESTWFSVLSQQIENEEDPELAAASLQKIAQYINVLQYGIQDAIAAFNAENADFQREVDRILLEANIDLQEAIAQAREDGETSRFNALQTLAEQVQEYEMRVRIYQAEVQGYQAEVQGAVEAWRADELEAKINYYLREYQVVLNQFQLDIQNEAQEFNAELADYTREVDRLFQQAQITMQEEISELREAGALEQQDAMGDLQAQIAQAEQSRQRYMALLEDYQIRVNADLQEWQNNEWNAKYMVWVQKYNNALQEYSIEIQNELNEFEATVIDFNADVQSAFNQAQITLQEEIAQLQASASQEEQNTALALQAQIEDVRADVSIYQAQVQGYVGEIRGNVDAWTANVWNKELQRYWNDYGIALQEYQADIQNELNEFQASVVDFNADVESAFNQAQITLQEKLADLQASSGQEQQNTQLALEAQISQARELSTRYQAEVQGYLGEVRGAIDEWTANEWNLKIQYYLQEYQTVMQNYQLDMQNELNEFQAAVVDFQADVESAFNQAQITLQEALTNAQLEGSQEQQNTELDLQAQIAQAAAEAQRFSVLVGNYSTQVESAIQVWTANEWNAKFIVWQNEYQFALQQYMRSMICKSRCSNGKKTFSIIKLSFRNFNSLLNKHSRIGICKSGKENLLNTETSISWRWVNTRLI